MVRLPDGTRERVSGSAPRHNNTKVAAQRALLDHIERLTNPARAAMPRKEVPTFAEWFEGRFWNEWVIAQENKPSEQISKRSIFETHLRSALGDVYLDEIDTEQVQRFKAELAEKVTQYGGPLGAKTRNNILAVLSKALRYAEEVKLISSAPRVRLYNVERPEIVVWDFAEYARLVEAAGAEGPEWRVAVLLAGEAGLRLGEVLALRWEDVDLIAATVTVCRQVRRGHEGTPKGRTRRAVVMTRPLGDALRALCQIRTGRVVCGPDGMPVTEGVAKHHIYRFCRRAGLPERSWHVLRHSLATHAASFGVNPWSLQRWLGHKRIDETMRYVHYVEQHPRPIPEMILAAADGIADPDARVLAMLGARGKGVAKTERPFIQGAGIISGT